MSLFSSTAPSAVRTLPTPPPFVERNLLTEHPTVFLKYLDQANITNAYVSGLAEDFDLVGNELNYFNVCYYVALVVFQIPGMLILTRPKMYEPHFDRDILKRRH